MLSPDYAHHEQIYQSLKSRGATGWSAEGEYEEMLVHIVPSLNGAGVLPPAQMLELGSGAGNLSIALAKIGYQVHGVEISKTAVDWSVDRLADQTDLQVSFGVDDVVTLSTCESDSFDAVVDGHCLHCIIGSDRASCLASVARVLRPGGVLVILTMCGDVLSERVRSHFDPEKRVVVIDNRPTRYVGRAEDIVEEIRKAGFHVETFRVDPRRGADDQDDLIVVARKPLR